jgi:biopolymer transport protein TolR
MLVLLIIFMITAPLLQVGVPVDLPKTSAQQVGGKDEPLVVSVNSKDEVFLGETKYELTICPTSQGGARGEAHRASSHPR